MYQQQVKHVPYLAKAVINLDETIKGYKAIVLPAGAEILQVSVEIKTPNTAGGKKATPLNIGLNEVEDFFIKDIDLSAEGTHTSAKITSMNEKSFVSVNTENSNAKIILRVLYFLKSEIMTEY
ncbi:hypothetical protein DMB92_05260 [Campylobacter sp. MIT 99-7217]|uniref:hypothetical protein n=1 Tax=Campylobacter sp. MIT 99-7217 TaxID=535091 RepID=UPI00115AE17D|nr:hypothetical protein [Campylobacter sp. MIT 99-7217]TQR31797.1 hypothetical protein DMB92_05260 [Campylobacter sp. MIT 99-7217]